MSPSFQEKTRRFHDLAPYRIREILLVSSPYDAFVLEEDGQLSEQVFREYRDLSLSGPPRVTHVPGAEEAADLLEDRRFDLILVMSSLAGMSVNDFARQVKRPGWEKAVVYLALDQKELEEVQDSLDPGAVDGTFLWSGDSLILLAIIKSIEDRANLEHDIREGNVRVILVVEDSPRYYSSFLGMLFEELMKHARSLYAEGVNELQRRMYMRSRPKILHATTYEGGWELFERHRSNLLAVISDLRIPHGGELDPKGGLEFVAAVRDELPDLPVLLQSAENEYRERAIQSGAVFANKRSPNLLGELRTFLRENLGFGDFVFRRPDGEEVDRAVDVRDLERKLENVPEEVLEYHARHDNFSIWLMARSEFELAERLRPKRVDDFASMTELRRFLVDALHETRDVTQQGEINDFRRETFEQDLFSRIGRGSLGGKGRGIAFLNLQLALRDEEESFSGLPVRVPKTVVLATDVFDSFVGGQGLKEFALECDDDREIATRFLERPLPIGLLSDLRFIVEHMRGPLAVRSSSVLEDSMHQPFAGIYTTLMIPNLADSADRRLRELSTAIRLVFASTFFRNAKSYLETAGTRVEEERMAVIVQTVVGRQRGDLFYPNFSGVAQSHNFYPIGPQRAEDGVVHLALGLGRTVVDGGQALRFSPRHPGVLPQLATRSSMLKSTQRDFWAIDVDRPCCEPDADLYSTLTRHELKRAEEDGTLDAVASVFSADDQRLRADLTLSGPRVVTFDNFLKHRALPLVDALAELLQVTRAGLGCPVEIEFACDLGDWGQPASRREGREAVLYALQVRPFAARTLMTEPARLAFEREETLCASSRALGHGIDESIRDVVYVRPESWDPAHNKEIAREVGELNRELGGDGASYLLIGPGRWGTADPWLGIPVQWAEISNVRLIVEASPSGYEVEPSQGTHFFQNITSLRIGYLTLPGGADKERGDEEFVDWRWLAGRPSRRETKYLRHVRLDEPLIVALDGRESRGIVAKPGASREVAPVESAEAAGR